MFLYFYIVDFNLFYNFLLRISPWHKYFISTVIYFNTQNTEQEMQHLSAREFIGDLLFRILMPPPLMSL